MDINSTFLKAQRHLSMQELTFEGWRLIAKSSEAERTMFNLAQHFAAILSCLRFSSDFWRW